MTASLFHGMLAGLALALSCGDAPKAAGAEARPAHSPLDPCTLLTQEEAEAILRTATAPPEPRGASLCRYGSPDGQVEVLLGVLSREFASREEFDAMIEKDTERMNERMKKGFEHTGATPPLSAAVPAPEVGSPAYYVDPTLVVLKGRRAVSIVAADRAQAVAVALKVLPRME